MSMQSGQGWDKSSMESMKTPGMGAQQITTYLKGIEFPADKQKIVDMAKSKGAPDMVVQWLNKLPNKQYKNSMEVEQEFGKLK
jgi:hypothetical protein